MALGKHLKRNSKDRVRMQMTVVCCRPKVTWSPAWTSGGSLRPGRKSAGDGWRRWRPDCETLTSNPHWLTNRHSWISSRWGLFAWLFSVSLHLMKHACTHACMRACTYMHAHMRAHMHTHTDTHTHPSIHMHAHTCMPVSYTHLTLPTRSTV